MLDIDEIELRRLDLTVLLVFLNLMRFGKATDVAGHMGLTQSSISHSIKRLRDAFGDPLFLRTPRGMEPTAVAQALEPRIRAAVETLSQALASPVGFDPATAERTIRIGAYDNEMTTLVPELIHGLRSQAPGMRIAVLPIGRGQALEALESRSIDLALGFIWDLPRQFRADALYTETYRVVCRAGHPLAARIGTMDGYCAADHVVVSPAGEFHGIVDDELGKAGRSRRVAASLPLFLPTLALVSSSDLIATLPRRLVRCHGARYALLDQPPPVAVRSFTVSAIRHARDAANPLHQWVIDQLTRQVGPASSGPMAGAAGDA